MFNFYSFLYGSVQVKAKLAKSQESESVEKVEQPVEKASSETIVSEETSKPASESPANGPAVVTTTTTEAPAPTPGAYIPPALKRQMEAAAAAAAGSGVPSAASSAPAAAATSSAPVGKYIPPSMRNKAPEGGSLIGSNVTAPKKPGKAQPNIMDTFEFPTLDAAAPAETGEKLTNGNSDK